MGRQGANLIYTIHDETSIKPQKRYMSCSLVQALRGRGELPAILELISPNYWCIKIGY